MTNIVNTPDSELNFQNSVTEALPGFQGELRAFKDAAVQNISDAGLSEYGIGIVYMGGSALEGSLTLTDREAGPGMAEFKQVLLAADESGNVAGVRIQHTVENESGTSFSRNILEDSTFTIRDTEGVLHLDAAVLGKRWTQGLDKKPECITRTDDPKDLEYLQAVLQGGAGLLAADVRTRQEMKASKERNAQASSDIMPEATAAAKSRLKGVRGLLNLSRNK